MHPVFFPCRYGQDRPLKSEWFGRWIDDDAIVHWVENIQNARVFTSCCKLVADRSMPMSGYPGYSTTKDPPSCLFCIADKHAFYLFSRQ